MRILVTISPRLYREVLALAIHRHRPDFEVLMARPWPLDGSAERFAPHVMVQDAEEAGLPSALAGGVLCRVWILVSERVDARVEMDGVTSQVHDASLGDLFEMLEKAQVRAAG